MSTNNIDTRDETAIRELVENWARAVRAKDYDGILANHSKDIVMFDVPPPFESRGIESYRKTWDLFFSWAADPPIFEIKQMEINASSDIAFIYALMHCSEREKGGETVELDFRLTVGLRKIDGKWTVLHEHHSIPAT